MLSKAEAAGVTLSDLEPLLIAADENGAMQVGAGAGAYRGRKLQPSPSPTLVDHSLSLHHTTQHPTHHGSTIPPYTTALPEPPHHPAPASTNHPANPPTPDLSTRPSTTPQLLGDVLALPITPKLINAAPGLLPLAGAALSVPPALLYATAPASAVGE